MLKLTSIFLLCLFSASSFAQNSVQTKLKKTPSNSTTSQTEAPVKKPSKWTADTTVGYSSNLYEKDSHKSTAFANLELNLNYKVKDSHVLRANMSGYQEEAQGRETRLNDGFLAWSNAEFWRKGEILTIGQQVSAILPTSKVSNVRDEKRIGVGVAPSFVGNLTPVGLTGVTLVYQPFFIKNFHKFEQNRAYKKNVEHSIMHIFAVKWDITDKFFFQSALVYLQAWAYGAERRDDNFLTRNEVGYSFTPSVIASLGFTNAGPVRSFENGNDQTVQVFDEKTTSVFTELKYAF